MMLVYNRNIHLRVMVLRLLFFVLVVGCVFAFTSSYLILGYVLAITLLGFSIAKVENLIVRSEAFLVVKYYCFGLIKKTWQLNKGENIKISSPDPDFGEETVGPDFGADAEALGCLFTVFSAFMPSKITKRIFKIKRINEVGDIAKTVQIRLNREEFNYLQIFIDNKALV